MKLPRTDRLVVAIVALGFWAPAVPAEARTTLGSICRVKGQEENTLQGLGFVVGLEGTGDDGSFLPAIRSLAKAMELMGEPLGSAGLTELKDVKNMALVSVTATVPAGGARQGDKLDCTVSSIGSAKSLEGGRLFLTALTGPDRNDPRIYAFARGAVTLDDPKKLTRTGRIHGGCRIEADFFNVFTKDGKFALVLDKDHAGFQVAQQVAHLINSQPDLQSGGLPPAEGLDAVNISVTIPPQYRSAPAMFVSQVLALALLMEPETGARVVINERAGSIVITGDVEIGAAAIAHKNVVVETGGATTAGQFVQLDIQETPKLKALVEALNAVNVPTVDTIEIIKRINRSGKLYGRLIIE